jgi:uncharacterized protein
MPHPSYAPLPQIDFDKPPDPGNLLKNSIWSPLLGGAAPKPLGGAALQRCDQGLVLNTGFSRCGGTPHTQRAFQQSARSHRPRSVAQKPFAALYNILMASVPAEIHGQRYITLATFRKSGVPVYTPIWFAEDADKLYVMTNSKLGKCKRVRNNPQVKIASCTIRGKITGPEFQATARILPPGDLARVRQLIRQKYWLARLPFLWRNTDTSIEITPASV